MMGATFINPYQGLKHLRYWAKGKHRSGATFINPYQGLKQFSG